MLGGSSIPTGGPGFHSCTGILKDSRGILGQDSSPKVLWVAMGFRKPFWRAVDQGGDPQSAMGESQRVLEQAEIDAQGEEALES